MSLPIHHLSCYRLYWCLSCVVSGYHTVERLWPGRGESPCRPARTNCLFAFPSLALEAAFVDERSRGSKYKALRSACDVLVVRKYTVLPLYS